MNIFICYSHRDKKWHERLRDHLKPLLRDQDISVWSDREIMAGELWQDQIRKALDRAHCAVLLISTDFLGSDFIVSDELPSILRSAEQRGPLVIPIIVRHCLFNYSEQLKGFQAANDPSKPLDGMTKSRWENVLVDVAARVKDISIALKELSTTGRQNIAREANQSLHSGRALPLTLIDSRSFIPSESFCDRNHFSTLQKIGRWIYDEQNNTLI